MNSKIFLNSNEDHVFYGVVFNNGTSKIQPVNLIKECNGYKSDKKIIIKGSTIRISDIFLTIRCHDQLELVEIFASDTVIFDYDLRLWDNFDGLLVIIAPTWKIDGVRIIQAKKIAPFSVEDDLNFQKSTKGSFLGITTNIINCRKLMFVTENNIGPIVRYEDNCQCGNYQDTWLVKKKLAFDRRYTINARSHCSQLDSCQPEENKYMFWTDNSEIVRKPIIRTTLNPSNLYCIDISRRRYPKNQIIKDHIRTVLDDYVSFFQNNPSNFREISKILLSIMKQFQFNNTQAFIQNFVYFEKYSYMLNEKDLISLYQALLEQIPTHTNDENKKILTYLHTTILSKICALQDQISQTFITDLEKFFEFCIEDIEKLKHVESEITIRKYTTDYKGQLDEEIIEGIKLIDESITPEIEHQTRKIDKNIVQLTDEILEYQRQAERYHNELVEAKRKLKNIMIAKTTMNVVGGLSAFLAFLGPVGTIAGAAVGIGSQIGNVALDDIERNIDNSLKKYVNLKEKFPGIVYASNKKATEEFLKQVVELKSLLTSETEFLRTDLINLETTLRLWKRSDGELLEKYSTEIRKVQEKLGILSGNPTISQTAKKLEKATNNILNAAPIIVKTSLDTYQLIRRKQEKIDCVASIIEENEQTILLFKNYQKRVEDTLKPLVNEMKETIDHVGSTLRTSSSIRLEVSKWKVQTSLNEIKQILQDFTKGFSEENEFRKSINAIIDAIITMSNVYQKIQNLQHQKKFADYITNINSAGFRNIPIVNQEWTGYLHKLELYLKSNIVLQKYRQSLEQIKQYAFPLPETYFKHMDLPQVLQTEDDIETYTRKAIKHIENFRLKLADSSMYILKHDDIKHKWKFYDWTLAGPFFVWKSATYRESITQLLSGKEVFLYAEPGSQNKNSIKFNLIGLRFKCPNANYQQKLNEVLNTFQVSLTHTGNNYYNCNNKTYVINTQSQKFQFSFETVDDEPVNYNIVFDKIRKGSFFLSPYTTWKMQLNTTNWNNFEELRTYGEGCDLQLVGEGEFYEDDWRLCSQNLENYYELLKGTQHKEFSYDLFKNADKSRLTCDSWMDSPQSFSVYSGASTFSSPINDFFKWFNEKINFFQCNTPSSSLWNAELAFNQFNSVLVLASIFIHFTLSESEEQKPPAKLQLEPIEETRKELWTGFLDNLRNLVMKYNIQTKWIIINLEDRHEEVEMLGTAADVEDINRLESNLVILLVDFLDDIMYDDCFIGIRTDKRFNKSVKRLVKIASKIKNFDKLFNSSQCSYC